MACTSREAGSFAAVAAVAGVLLAGCGGSSGTRDAEVSSRIERFIASDIRQMAIRAGIGGVITVHGVSCTEVDGTHFTCQIRSSNDYGAVKLVADATYDPATEITTYNIRP